MASAAAGAPATATQAPTKAEPARSDAPSAQAPAAPKPAVETPPFTGLPTGPGRPIDPGIIPQDPQIPMDSRPALRSTNAVPISGGTLLVTPDALTAVVSDPDRDRISIVDLFGQRVAATLALSPGDEPGRLVQDGAGRVHAVLRRGGAVVSIDLVSRKIVARRAVCAAPRGIAYDAAAQQLKVACASGELINLPAASGEATGKVQVSSDLRDVVLTSNGAFVSRMKDAELVRLDASGKPLSAARPDEPALLFPMPDGSQVADTFEPRGARRVIGIAGGGVIMLHQGARNGDIAVKPTGNVGSGSSPYGGTGTCSGVVSTSITQFDDGGKLVATNQFAGVLAVDIAQDPTSREILVALAGSPDPTQPRAQPGDEFVMGAVSPASGELETIAVLHFNPADFGLQTKSPGLVPCMPPIMVTPIPGQAVAVAFANGRAVIQSREPAALFISDSALNPSGFGRVQIALGGASVFDTGHEIFHRDAGGGVACASCHLEAGDDGHTWHFVDQGPRRTQSMFVGLEGTAPFHWVGDMGDLPTLMEHVFVGRMGGVHQSVERVGALESWLYALKAPPATRVASDPAAERGHALFVGQAECGKCHNGPKLTNNETVDVGTGVELQVPSLVAVGYRGPWLHDGCATTLRDRFRPECGGEKHGRVDALTSTQIDDLVAYLETL